jgi:hypothetical protein
MRKMGTRRILHDFVVPSLCIGISKNEIPLFFASLSSRESHPDQIQKYSFCSEVCCSMSETIGVTCHPVPPHTKAIL